MDFSIAVLFAATGIAILDTRIEQLKARGSEIEYFSRFSSPLGVIDSTVDFAAAFSLIVLGFLYIEWWKWLLIFLGGRFFITLIVTPRVFAFCYFLRPLFSLCVVVLAVVLWAEYFDFIRI